MKGCCPIKNLTTDSGTSVTQGEGRSATLEFPLAPPLPQELPLVSDLDRDYQLLTVEVR